MNCGCQPTHQKDCPEPAGSLPNPPIGTTPTQRRVRLLYLRTQATGNPNIEPSRRLYLEVCGQARFFGWYQTVGQVCGSWVVHNRRLPASMSLERAVALGLVQDGDVVTEGSPEMPVYVDEGVDKKREHVTKVEKRIEAREEASAAPLPPEMIGASNPGKTWKGLPVPETKKSKETIRRMKIKSKAIGDKRICAKWYLQVAIVSRETVLQVHPCFFECTTSIERLLREVKHRKWIEEDCTVWRPVGEETYERVQDCSSTALGDCMAEFDCLVLLQRN